MPKGKTIEHEGQTLNEVDCYCPVCQQSHLKETKKVYDEQGWTTKVVESCLFAAPPVETNE